MPPPHAATAAAAILGFKFNASSTLEIGWIGIGISSSSRKSTTSSRRSRRSSRESSALHHPPIIVSLSKSSTSRFPWSCPTTIQALTITLPPNHPPPPRIGAGAGAGAGIGAGIGQKEEKEEEEEEAVEREEEDPWQELQFLDPEVDGSMIREWELDFCSRPILDQRGKKVWELVCCDATLSLQYTRFFPNNVINSLTLRDAIASISTSLAIPLPQKIRFFRSQMQTIITKACNELGIKPVPSKRCISLSLWLEERYQTVYTRHPGFQQGSKPLLALDNPFPTELPDNLFGDKWAFVQLPFSAVRKEASSFQAGYAFDGSLDMDLLGIEIEDNTLIPGLAVASSRAKPLAAWMNGLEVCSVEVDVNRACLYLSVGVSTRYIYATYKKNAATTLEAEAWEASKKVCGGLHFLAIQERLDSDDCVGFWLLLDLPPPPV